MRITAIRLAIVGLGLAATPALAQMYGSQVQTAPLPGSPVYAAPIVAPATAPTGAAAEIRNAPGVGEPFRIAPAPAPVAPAYAAPVIVPVVPTPMWVAVPNPSLPMQGEILNGGDRTSAVADVVAPTTSPIALLGQAEQAARQGRLPLASELVERAESLLLTRSTIAGTEAIPVRDGAVARLAQARVALGRRNVNTATTLMAEAASMTRSLGM